MANPYISSATITPSGQLLHVVPLKADGTTALNYIVSVADGATLNVNGTPIALQRPIYSVGNRGVHWPLGAVPLNTPVLVDDGDAVCTSTGTWAAGPTAFITANDAVNSAYRVSTDPAATWSWPFADLATGGRFEVLVKISELVAPGNTTQAVYTVRDGSNAVVGTFALDQTDAVACKWLRTELGVMWVPLGNVDLDSGTALTVTLSNGAGAGTLIADAIALKPLFRPVFAPGDTLTVTLPAGTIGVANTVGGTGIGTDPVTDFPVTVLTDDDFLPVPAPGDRTLECGFNLDYMQASLFVQTLADRSIGSRWEGDVTLDEHYEMTANTGTAKRLLTYAPNGDGLSPRGTYTLADGVCRIEFNVSGATFDATARANVTIHDFNNNCTIGPATFTDLGAARWRMEQSVVKPTGMPLAQRTFAYQDTWSYWLYFIANTPGVVYTDWRFYGPEVPTDWTKTAAPGDVGDLSDGAGNSWVGAFRSMDILSTNASQAWRVGDFMTPADRSCFDTGATYDMHRTAVTSIRPVDFDAAGDPDYFQRYFDKSGINAWFVAEVADATGFADGSPLAWEGSDGHYPSTYGTTLNATYIPLAYKIDATHLLIICASDVAYDPGTTAPYNRSTLATTQALTGVSLVTKKTSHFPFETFLAYCGDVGAPPWVNVPHLASDALALWMAQQTLAATPAGRKVYVEYSNETWNPFFVQWGYFTSQSFHADWLHAQDPASNPAIPGGPYGWQAYRASQVHAIWRQAWADAGRDPADVVRLCGLQTQNPGASAAGCGQAIQSLGLTFDAFATEDYQEYCSVGFDFLGSDLAGACTRLDRDGLIDSLWISVTGGQRERWVDFNTSVLQSYGVSDPVHVAYEGGWGGICPTFGRTTAEQARMAYEMMASPRMHRATAARLSREQAMGYQMCVRFMLAQYSSPGSTAMWSDRYTADQRPGTGSPSENPNPLDWPDTVSESLGGTRAFATGASFSSSPPRAYLHLAVGAGSFSMTLG